MLNKGFKVKRYQCFNSSWMMFTSDVVPQTGILVTVSWWASWSCATRITRPPRCSCVTRTTRGARAACPSLTWQACGTVGAHKVSHRSTSNKKGLQQCEKKGGKWTENAPSRVRPTTVLSPLQSPLNPSPCCRDNMTEMTWFSHLDKGDDSERPEGRCRNNTVLSWHLARGFCFLFSREKRLHQDSLQQSAEIWNQYFEGDAVCQVLKSSIIPEKHSGKTESSPLYLQNILLHILKFGDFFFFKMVIWS